MDLYTDFARDYRIVKRIENGQDVFAVQRCVADWRDEWRDLSRDYDTLAEAAREYRGWLKQEMDWAWFALPVPDSVIYEEVIV